MRYRQFQQNVQTIASSQFGYCRHSHQTILAGLFYRSAVIAPFIIFSLVLSALFAPLCSSRQGRTCGVDALYQVCLHYNLNIPYGQVHEACHPTQDGNSMLDLFQAAQQLGFSALGMRLEWKDLVELDSPAIAFVNGNHFVAVLETDTEGDRVKVVDYPEPEQWQSREEFEEIWIGETLVVSWSPTGSSERNQNAEDSEETEWNQNRIRAHQTEEEYLELFAEIDNLSEQDKLDLCRNYREEYPEGQMACQATYYLAQSVDSLGLSEEAMKLYEELIERFDRQKEWILNARWELFRLYVQSEDWHKCKQILLLIEKESPQGDRRFKEMSFYRGYTHYRLKQNSLAIDFLKDYLDYSDSTPRKHLALSIVKDIVKQKSNNEGD